MNRKSFIATLVGLASKPLSKAKIETPIPITGPLYSTGFSFHSLLWHPNHIKGVITDIKTTLMELSCAIPNDGSKWKITWTTTQDAQHNTRGRFMANRSDDPEQVDRIVYDPSGLISDFDRFRVGFINRF